MLYFSAPYSCVSVTPGVAQNLNMAVKTGDGNNSSRKNLSNVAERFGRSRASL